MDYLHQLLPAVLQLYGAQTMSIDTGAAEDWADTFTPSGRFESPSYPHPVIGRDELVRFAKDFAVSSPRTRHVVVNAHVTKLRFPDQISTAANLMIVRTDRTGAVDILRMTTIQDTLVKMNAQWKIQRRQVTLQEGI